MSLSDQEQPERARGRTYQPTAEEVEAVNTAIHLRRPLLIEGPPGVGKSSLAASVAYQLRLGPVLRWPVNTRSTLVEGLYQYDAVARLQQVAAQSARLAHGAQAPGSAPQPAPGPADGIVEYLRLGPLGTALLPWEHPRVVLIDEFDKGDIDLPNDLLNLMEEGWFLIPELARLRSREPIRVTTADG
ncbi:MAG TPA: AAA family ATPase, partial [Chloroflexaceae bacterium]|nr:AAA family ATPase [Chloroflexaceae bacterium]